VSDELRRFRLASGIELAGWDSGPKDAPALVFLHGFPESHRSWRHQIAHFSGRYRCIAPDQRGYGQSSKPQEIEAYTTDKLTADVF
jgi:pimeloyl-ACP methyl ester carboxylesterase